MPNNISITLLKRATYISIGTLVARISAAIAGIIIARVVGPAPFGVYAAVWALIEMASSFSEIGMTTELKREGARNPHYLSLLLGNTLIVKIILCVFSTFIAYLYYSSITTSANASKLFLPLAIAGFSVVCSEPFFASLQVKGEQKLVSFLMMGRGVLFLACIVLFAFFESDIVVFAWIQGLLYFITLFIVYFKTTPIVPITKDFSRILSQVKSSVVFGISSILYSIYIQTPILFLSYYRPADEVGYFAVGLRFVTLAFLAGAVASNDAFIPKLFGLYKTSREAFSQVCESMQRLFVALGFLGASALYVCADVLIITLQGEEYRPAVGILRILCWALVLNYGALAPGAILTAADRMWIKIAFQICVTLLTFIAGFVIINPYGTIGASYLILILWSSVVVLYIPYLSLKKLISFSGITKLLVPISLTVFLSILIVYFIPDHIFLSPTIFFLGSIMLWRTTAIKLLKKSFALTHATEEA